VEISIHAFAQLIHPTNYTWFVNEIGMGFLLFDRDFTPTSHSIGNYRICISTPFVIYATFTVSILSKRKKIKRQEHSPMTPFSMKTIQLVHPLEGAPPPIDASSALLLEKLILPDTMDTTMLDSSLPVDMAAGPFGLPPEWQANCVSEADMIDFLSTFTSLEQAPEDA